MCSSHSGGPHKLRGTSASMGFFISLPLPPLFLFTWQSAACGIVPRTLTLFKLDQKTCFLVNKQIRNLFSAQHTLSAFQVPLHTLASSLSVLLLVCQNIPTNPKLSSINQYFYLGHILRDAAVTMTTNLLDSGQGRERKNIVIVLLCYQVYLIVIKKLEPDPGCVCASPRLSLLNIVINPQNRFRVN